jgi:hypothetical protein
MTGRTLGQHTALMRRVLTIFMTTEQRDYDLVAWSGGEQKLDSVLNSPSDTRVLLGASADG